MVSEDWRPTPEDWQPVSEERVWDKINEEWPLMDFQQRRLWDIVKIVPEKWSNEQKYYDHGSWVVAIIGSWVVWYDDIEDEFPRSRWTKYGVIATGQYGYDSGLATQLQDIWNLFTTEDIGTPFGRRQ